MYASDPSSSLKENQFVQYDNDGSANFDKIVPTCGLLDLVIMCQPAFLKPV